MPAATFKVSVARSADAVEAERIARAAIVAKLSEPPESHPDLMHFVKADVGPLKTLLDQAAQAVAAGNPFSESQRSASGVAVTVDVQFVDEQTVYSITFNDEV